MKKYQDITADELDEEIRQIFFGPCRTKVDKALRVVCIISAAVSFLSSICYLYFRKIVPGLSPLTLALVLIIFARDIYKRQKEIGRKDPFYLTMALVLVVACILNVIAAVMQIIAYLSL